jgi:hypothetical protein
VNRASGEIDRWFEVCMPKTEEAKKKFVSVKID